MTWARLYLLCCRFSCCLLSCYLFAVGPVWAELVFPKLTGRIVDNAGMMGPAVEQRLGEFLAGHERATGNQIVVVTVESLQGYAIETFGYQLGRAWGIGQKGQDNGVLLIVAQQERKIRIEVGYGLEGLLTDAISANIIHTIISPAFKRGRFEGGIDAGARAIVQALGGEYAMRESRHSGTSKNRYIGLFILIFILFNFVGAFFGGGGLGGRRRQSSYYGGGFGRGSFGGGGGFSGGGGGFGGGGASGGW